METQRCTFYSPGIFRSSVSFFLLRCRFNAAFARIRVELRKQSSAECTMHAPAWILVISAEAPWTQHVHRGVAQVAAAKANEVAAKALINRGSLHSAYANPKRLPTFCGKEPVQRPRMPMAIPLYYPHAWPSRLGRPTSADYIGKCCLRPCVPRACASAFCCGRLLLVHVQSSCESPLALLAASILRHCF